MMMQEVVVGSIRTRRTIKAVHRADAVNAWGERNPEVTVYGNQFFTLRPVSRFSARDREMIEASPEADESVEVEV
jgi:hypothetical protein